VLADSNVRENIDVVLVQGHSDERGSISYNRELSGKRANAVLNYMFEADRSLEQSYGRYFASSAYSEFRPVSPDQSEAAHRENRRIEISLVLKDASIRGVIDEYMRQLDPTLHAPVGPDPVTFLAADELDRGLRKWCCRLTRAGFAASTQPFRGPACAA
jgi:hypothetical protein